MQLPMQLTQWLARILFHVGPRFWYDDLFSRGAALAYTTLFALVPLTALSIVMYTALGVDEAKVGRTIGSIMNIVLPPIEAEPLANAKNPDVEEEKTNEENQSLASRLLASRASATSVRNQQLVRLRTDVTAYLLALGQNAKTLGIVTIAILFFIGVMLLNTVESALNTIWRVTPSFSGIGQKLVNFWAVITFGPVFILLSIYLTTKAQGVGLPETGLNWDITPYLQTFGAITVTTIALSLMYFTLPATNVRLRDAIFGGIVASILFEFLKEGFAYYLMMSSAYSSLYGVLASVPLFLFWLYLTWVVVLLGAEVAYLSGAIEILTRIQQFATPVGEAAVIIGLSALVEIAQRHLVGKSPATEGELSVKTGAEPSLMRQILDLLSNANMLTPEDTRTRSRTLLRSPQTITLANIQAVFCMQYANTNQITNVAEGINATGIKLLRNASLMLPPERAVSSWTLAEMLESLHPTSSINAPSN